MVLICNNNVLTIEKFHKHRCEEKAQIRNIVANYKETHVVEREPMQTLEQFLASVESMDIKTTRSIPFNRQ